MYLKFELCIDMGWSVLGVANMQCCATFLTLMKVFNIETGTRKQGMWPQTAPCHTICHNLMWE